MVFYPKVLLLSVVLVIVCLLTLPAVSRAQVSEQVQVQPPLMRIVEPPSPDATAAALESRADELHEQKLFLDAIDYYRAALAKAPNDAHLWNKVCRTQLMITRWHDAQKSCEHSIKADRNFADPYNNLGVAFYGQLKFRASIKQYERAIALDDLSASFYSNLGAAYFARKEYDKAGLAYQRAMELDPGVFERSSRSGLQAQLPSPEDRARYNYTVARLYAKMGLSDRSLEYLKKAMEEGYKDFKNVYKDAEFAELRKDKRFTELMAAKTPSLPE